MAHLYLDAIPAPGLIVVRWHRNNSRSDLLVTHVAWRRPSERHAHTDAGSETTAATKAEAADPQADRGGLLVINVRTADERHGSRWKAAAVRGKQARCGERLNIADHDMHRPVLSVEAALDTIRRWQGIRVACRQAHHQYDDPRRFHVPLLCLERNATRNLTVANMLVCHHKLLCGHIRRRDATPERQEPQTVLSSFRAGFPIAFAALDLMRSVFAFSSQVARRFVQLAPSGPVPLPPLRSQSIARGSYRRRAWVR